MLTLFSVIKSINVDPFLSIKWNAPIWVNQTFYKYFCKNINKFIILSTFQGYFKGNSKLQWYISVWFLAYYLPSLKVLSFVKRSRTKVIFTLISSNLFWIRSSITGTYKERERDLTKLLWKLQHFKLMDIRRTPSL